MQLVVDDYGIFIGKEGSRIKVVQKDKTSEFSIDKIDQIVISRASSISSEAVKLCTENNVDIVFLNHFGMPYARIYPCTLGGTTLTRKKQAEATQSEKIVDIIKSIVGAKMRNQLYLLKSLEKTRQNADFSKEINLITDAITDLERQAGRIEEMRGEIMGLEGFASRQYFACLSSFLPFKERQHHANDQFNTMLNYGYGILYSEVEKACMLAGLDPYLGFLHTDRYGKPSLVLDMIENFRQPIVDRAIITLFAQKQVNEKDTEISGTDFLLTKEGRKKVSEAVLARLHTEIKHRGKKATFQSIILEQARDVVKILHNDSEKFEPFVHKW